MPVMPSDKEEEYFLRLELEQRKKREEERKKQVAEEEKRRLKELHHMHCPKCGMELREIDYKGIKVDKCFHCEGIWLDAGEMEAIGEMEKGAMKRMFSLFKA
ncbi:MAG: zf-TFIIB domain-containing protein [Bacteroidetes bacterium]|nr:MAG: zf-TFIIB domain-containing protein [Bacteroidota bacterium]